MPFINHVHPSQYPQIQKIKLVQTDSMASNGSFFGYGSKVDSGIADENASGMSVGVIPDALVDIVQGDFNSQGSGMLGSEPQSEVKDLCTHDMDNLNSCPVAQAEPQSDVKRTCSVISKVTQ